MEISEIKSRLTLSEVIKYYGLKADKQNRLKCPFHEDKTPSMQLYYKTQTAYCFSTNCKTHGKAVDVIDFILHKENCTKHEAIKKAQLMMSDELGIMNGGGTKNNSSVRAMFLERMFTYFKNAVSNSKPAQEYLQSRCIEFRNTEVGYNAGQFYHGSRKDEVLIKDCVTYGLLLDAGLTSNTGDKAYKPFGKWCIVFALRNKANEIASLYFRSTLQDKAQRHYYLRDRQGLYPHYPPTNTKKLILTESVIDAASLLQQPEIASKYNLLALYGTNGFTEEHQKSITALKELEEIIFFLNGDEAGEKAVARYAPMLQATYPNLKITSVAVPQNEDVNSLLQGHSPEILTHLIDTRIAVQSPIPLKDIKEPLAKEVDFIFSNEKSNEKENTQQAESIVNIEPQPTETTITGLNTNNPYNLKYQGNEAMYQIKGFRVEQLDSLKITLQIQIQ
jgi:DNA primase